MASGVFASNEVVKEKELYNDVCCRRGTTNSSGENVTVRACVPSTGDAQIDMGKACEKAKRIVDIAAAEL